MHGGFKVLCVSLRVRSSIVSWNPWMQIALEWLYDCCHAGLGGTDCTASAASRFLAMAPACIGRVSFATMRRKSYWNGCIKAAMLICQQIYSIFALIIFLSKFLFKSKCFSNRPFVCFGAEIQF